MWLLRKTLWEWHRAGAASEQGPLSHMEQHIKIRIPLTGEKGGRRFEWGTEREAQKQQNFQLFLGASFAAIIVGGDTLGGNDILCMT